MINPTTTLSPQPPRHRSPSYLGHWGQSPESHIYKLNVIKIQLIVKGVRLQFEHLFRRNGEKYITATAIPKPHTRLKNKNGTSGTDPNVPPQHENGALGSDPSAPHQCPTTVNSIARFIVLVRLLVLRYLLYGWFYPLLRCL